MNILVFLLLPVLVVSAYALAQWVRTRQPSSVESGVDAFRREMTALSPDAAPVHRRPERPDPAGRPEDQDRPERTDRSERTERPSGPPGPMPGPAPRPPSSPPSSPPSASRPPRRPGSER